MAIIKKNKLIYLLSILIILLLNNTLIVFSLDEFTDDYENEDHVSIKDNIVRNNTLNAMELSYTELEYMTDIIVQLREHNVYSNPSYNPAMTFSQIDGGENNRLFSSVISMGAGYRFVVVKRVWLNGKYLRFYWDGSCQFSKQYAYCYVRDGNYRRDNDTQFPNGAGPIDMGNGVLQMCVIVPAATSFSRTDDVLIDVSGGTLENVTIFWQLSDGWNGISNNIDMNWFEINEGANGVGNLIREEFNETLTMERTGTLGDYGYLYSSSLPYVSGGYSSSGYFYTDEVLDDFNDSSIVLLTNATLDGGSIKVEFSEDNSTWYDHNNNSGSDNIVEGFESIDLRDLNYSSLYMRYNYTRGGIEITPRLYQIRIVVGGVGGNGETEVNDVGALFIIGFIIGISLMIGVAVKLAK